MADTGPAAPGAPGGSQGAPEATEPERFTGPFTHQDIERLLGVLLRQLDRDGHLRSASQGSYAVADKTTTFTLQLHDGATAVLRLTEVPPSEAQLQAQRTEAFRWQLMGYPDPERTPVPPAGQVELDEAEEYLYPGFA